MEALLPSSELYEHQQCPYEYDTKEAEQWNRGQVRAVLDVQDYDDE